MKNIPHPIRGLLAAAGALAAAASLSAQSAPAPSSPAAAAMPTYSKDVHNEVLLLPEFNVTGTGEAANDYVPTQDASGARIKTPLKQLPYAVSTLDKDFFQDFGIFDLTDEMNFIPSLQGSDLSGGQTLRGFSGNNTQLRNGFAALGTRTMNGLNQISVIKGPAAMIYGQTSPGGTVFIDTVRPKTQQYEQVTETLGSFGTNATNAEVSGPIGSSPKLAYSIDVEDYERRFQDQVNRNLTREWLLTLSYKPSENTDFLFDGGYQITEQSPSQALPYLLNNGHFIGWAYQIKHDYYSTPVDYRSRQRNTAEMIFEHRFSQWLSFKAGANVYKYPNYTLTSGYTGTYDLTKPNVIGRSSTVSWSEFTGFGESYAAELLANYKVGPTRDTTLITFDYYNNIRRNELGAKSIQTYPTTESVLDPTLFPALPVNSQFFTYTVPAASTRSIQGPNGQLLSGSIQKLNESIPASGVDIAHEVFLFDDKLLLTAAFRHDFYQIYAKDDFWGITSKRHGNNDAVETGISYAVTKDINVYADETEGFLPPGTSTAMFTDVPKSTSLGYEAGIKGALLDNKLNFTGDIFKVGQRNVQESVFDPVTGLTTQQYIGGVNSQGFEGDLNWKISPRAYWYAAYQYLDTRLVNQISPGATGNNLTNGWGRQAGTPRHSLATTFRYEVYTGLAAMARMRYNSDAPTVTQNSNADLASGKSLVYSPAFAVWDVGLQYRFRTTQGIRLSHSVAFWVKNIFDKQYITPGGDRLLGDSLGFYLTYSLAH